MPVPNRHRDKDGTFEKKRGDTKVETLKKTYPEFENINGNTKLETLKEKYNTDSLDGVLKGLRKDNE
jgi:hypothetical protein